MYNKFKVKKKIISIALALVLAVQSLASLPMNAFAGNAFAGKRKSFGIDNIIGSEANEQIVESQTDFADDENVLDFDVSNYVKNITPQGATASYTVESQTAFADGENVLDEDGKVINPGIAKVKVTVNGVSKKTCTIADISGILGSAIDAAEDANAAAMFAGEAGMASLAAGAAIFAWESGMASLAAVEARSAAVEARSAAVEARSAAVKAAWNVAKNACESAKTALDIGLNLESELKTAYMAYRVAEAVWTQLGNNMDNLNKCKKRADALQELIDDACWPSNY